MELSLARMRQLAGSLPPASTLHQYSQEHRLAAVLMLAFPGADGLELVMTRRSGHLPNHAGQISFPGGKVEQSDPDPVYTALREAQEEIALDTETVEILGSLEVTTLPSGFAVAPVLGIAESRPLLTPNPEEVEEIFTLPLALACDLRRYGLDAMVRDGVRREFHYLQYGEYYIWGATARMLRSLALFLAGNG